MYLYQNKYKVNLPYTVRVNKNFTFRLRRTIVLRCDRFQENGVLTSFCFRSVSVPFFTVPFCSVFIRSDCGCDRSTCTPGSTVKTLVLFFLAFWKRDDLSNYMKR